MGSKKGTVKRREARGQTYHFFFFEETHEKATVKTIPMILLYITSLLFLVQEFGLCKLILLSKSGII
jgi:hypothetical protein